MLTFFRKTSSSSAVTYQFWDVDPYELAIAVSAVPQTIVLTRHPAYTNKRTCEHILIHRTSVSVALKA